MADRISKEQRSKNMAAVRGRGNISTEEKLASLFRKNKITGWRRHVKNIPGKPDFVFREKKLVVFVDGCFWHNCPKHKSVPKTNKKFWKEKIRKNVERDKKVKSELKQKGWSVLRVWEHELKKSGATTVRRIKRRLTDL